jgi:hypothetical protein
MEEPEDQEPAEIMAEFLTQFMASGTADLLYRKNYCEFVASKVHSEFGVDGLCELMVAMDRHGDWISDILFEAPDLDNIAFKNYGVFDSEISTKARHTKALQDFNEKIWRLRRKYAKLIVEEIMSWDNIPDEVEE